jgi:hypothetical protein
MILKYISKHLGKKGGAKALDKKIKKWCKKQQAHN